jgi:P27 family predicted phage terminase small subunit
MPAQVRDVWSACVAEMGANRHLRAPDLVLLRAYCEATYLHLQASAMIHAQGLMTEGAYGPVVNPMVKVQKDAATTMRQLSDVLGLNPLARIRGGLLEIAGQSMVLDIRERLVAKLAKG